MSVGVLFPFIGDVIGCDAKTAPGYRARVYLRETKTTYVDQFGRKWSKKKGYQQPRASFPLYQLDLQSVKPRANGGQP